MSIEVGVIGITPTGKYLRRSTALGHVRDKSYYTDVSDINHATVFKQIPEQKEYDVTYVPAYSEYIVRIGNKEKHDAIHKE